MAANLVQVVWPDLFRAIHVFDFAEALGT